jgi:hypothetical protein
LCGVLPLPPLPPLLTLSSVLRGVMGDSFLRGVVGVVALSAQNKIKIKILISREIINYNFK